MSTFVREFHNGLKLSILRNMCPIDWLIDIGCGRLNDLHKWKQLNIPNIIAVDPDTNQLLEGMKRLQSASHMEANVVFLQTEPGQEDFLKLLQQTIFLNSNICVTVFFALHYWCASEEALSHRLQTLYTAVPNKTRLAFTFMVGIADAPYEKYHSELVRHILETGGLELEHYKLKKKEFPIFPCASIEQYLKSHQPTCSLATIQSAAPIRPAGTALNIRLENAPYFVTEKSSIEYAVSLPLLKTSLKKCGFKKVRVEPFMQSLANGSAILLTKQGPAPVDISTIPLPALYFSSMHCTVYCETE